MIVWCLNRAGNIVTPTLERRGWQVKLLTEFYPGTILITHVDMGQRALRYYTRPVNAICPELLCRQCGSARIKCQQRSNHKSSLTDKREVSPSLYFNRCHVLVKDVIELITTILIACRSVAKVSSLLSTYWARLSTRSPT